jgi:organic hydroperoxide reductase OsmC/OhrA
LLVADPALHNPEDMLLSALSACHMLWYLHLVFEAGIVVLGYGILHLDTVRVQPLALGVF